MLGKISLEGLNQNAARIVAAMVGGLTGSLLIWFASLANTFPHGLGAIGMVVSFIIIVFGFAYTTISATGGWITTGAAAIYLVLTIVAVAHSFDDKLLDWNVGATWAAIIVFVMMALGELFYWALCLDEHPDMKEQWIFVVRAAVPMVLVALLLGLLVGLLGIQTLPPV